MKIKTITCHDVYNVGASLQAYALVTYLKSLGHDTEIIDYKPEYLSRHYRLWGGASPKFNKPLVREIYSLAKLPGRLKAKSSKRKKEYDSFKENYLPVTARRYSSNEELKQNPPQADVFFAGSDQIWNTKFPNGKDPAFFLDFAPDSAIRASYAASFAVSDIEDEWKDIVKSRLEKLDFIAVREKSGVKIIENLGINRSVQVSDPVFLLQREQWEKIAVSPETGECYILVYDFDGNTDIERLVKKLAEERQCKIYSVLPCSYADRCFDQEGPLMFLGLIRDAECVVSNSFHSTAFSVIFNKQFFVFQRHEGINTRMKDLMKDLGLSSRLISGGSVDEWVGSTIDYQQVEEKRESMAAYSKKYIDEVLKAADRKSE